MNTVRFDPYHRLLGIPQAEQPPHHYRLLGVQPFEPDLDVIATAADQRMTHLVQLFNSDRSEDAKRLHDEVVRARICLLNSDKKLAYDERLRKQLNRSGNGNGQPRVPRKPVHLPAAAKVNWAFTECPRCGKLVEYVEGDPNRMVACSKCQLDFLVRESEAITRQGTASVPSGLPPLPKAPDIWDELVPLQEAQAQPAVPASTLPRTSNPSWRSPKKRSRVMLAIQIILGGIGGLALGWLILEWLFPPPPPPPRLVNANVARDGMLQFNLGDHARLEHAKFECEGEQPAGFARIKQDKPGGPWIFRFWPDEVDDAGKKFQFYIDANGAPGGDFRLRVHVTNRSSPAAYTKGPVQPPIDNDVGLAYVDPIRTNDEVIGFTIGATSSGRINSIEPIWRSSASGPAANPAGPIVLDFAEWGGTRADRIMIDGLREIAEIEVISARGGNVASSGDLLHSTNAEGKERVMDGNRATSWSDTTSPYPSLHLRFPECDVKEIRIHTSLAERNSSDGRPGEYEIRLDNQGGGKTVRIVSSELIRLVEIGGSPRSVAAGAAAWLEAVEIYAPEIDGQPILKGIRLILRASGDDARMIESAWLGTPTPKGREPTHVLTSHGHRIIGVHKYEQRQTYIVAALGLIWDPRTKAAPALLGDPTTNNRPVTGTERPTGPSPDPPEPSPSSDTESRGKHFELRAEHQDDYLIGVKVERWQERIRSIEPIFASSPEQVSGVYYEDFLSPVFATSLRFEILATNDELPPCIDEIRLVDPNGKTNHAQWAQVTSSGQTQGKSRRISDGDSGDSGSWQSSRPPGKAWVQFDFRTSVSIKRITWSRDRSGAHRDRVPTEYQVFVNGSRRDLRHTAPQIQWSRFAIDQSAPGYAVGGLDVNAGEYVEGLKVTSMLVRDGKLDPHVTRTGEWIGAPPTAGLGNYQSSPDRRLPIGLYGYSDDEGVKSVGLLFPEDDSPSDDPSASARPLPTERPSRETSSAEPSAASPLSEEVRLVHLSRDSVPGPSQTDASSPQTAPLQRGHVHRLDLVHAETDVPIEGGEIANLDRLSLELCGMSDQLADWRATPSGRVSANELITLTSPSTPRLEIDLALRESRGKPVVRIRTFYYRPGDRGEIRTRLSLSELQQQYRDTAVKQESTRAKLAAAKAALPKIQAEIIRVRGLTPRNRNQVLGKQSTLLNLGQRERKSLGILNSAPGQIERSRAALAHLESVAQLATEVQQAAISFDVGRTSSAGDVSVIAHTEPANTAMEQ